MDSFAISLWSPKDHCDHNRHRWYMYFELVIRYEIIREELESS